jgi:hypothetical protein
MDHKMMNKSWASETRRRRFAFPYTFKERMDYVINNLFGPSKKYSNLTKFIPQTIQLNQIEPTIKVGFIGDIMRLGDKYLEFSENLRSFFSDIDYLVGNFEGTISSAKRLFLAQNHSKRILSSLGALFPPDKTVLACSNNHSGDFGWNEFNKSYQLLKDYGFIVLGRKDEPGVILDEMINIVNVTEISNQECLYVANIDDILASYKPKLFNILYPHWGYEVQLYPHPGQVTHGQNLLKKWDMIIGHHSHCPQPIHVYQLDNTNKLIAYSLGDFCFKYKIRKYLYGIALKADIGIGLQKQWQVGQVEWKFTVTNHLNDESCRVELIDECDYFPGIDPKRKN